jgi:hypothetical protein
MSAGLPSRQSGVALPELDDRRRGVEVVSTGGFPWVVGVGQLCPPLMTVATRNASVPSKSCTTTSVTPVLPGSRCAVAGASVAMPLRSSISFTVNAGSVMPSAVSSLVNGGR